MTRCWTFLLLTALLASTAAAQSVSSQAVLGEATLVELEIPTTSKDRCNIEIQIPDSTKIETEIQPPETKVRLELSAKSLRDLQVAWQGKVKFRGLKTVAG